ncbi:hypothetical protein TeGR_g12571 [Tetraparma gracilis]|uniref:Uncharacterized protein n=1 Tax=Tetraparma gracilis TaxID=2962635 RepID=A0ABQ6MAP4_9STRA|nr:hypothetical protein TeGR_g12571 [Tetraparma gracilis]
MVVGSFLTFVGITYYVSDKVTVKSTMVQVKGMTTTTYNLRQENRLSETNVYVALYEWYSPLRPYWESLLLARKLVLILASTTQFITDPLAQALIGTATNLAYLVLFEVKRPMLMQPSRLLRGKNLFHMIERAASVASLIGSIIAVLGAASPELVGLLGVLFALCNLGYATYVVGVFFFEEKKNVNLNQVAPDEKDWFGMSAWNSHVKLIDETDLAPAAREQMVGEMKLLRTKVVAAMAKEFGASEGEEFDDVGVHIEDALAKITADTTRIGGEAAKALGVNAMYKKMGLELVQVYARTKQPINTITHLKVPAYVTQLDKNAFEGCTALLTVELHDGVTEIGEAAFQDCSSLTELKIPASVSKLGNEIFKGCTALRTVELHDGVTEIGAAAFQDCRSLTELKIPASVSKLGNEIFKGCTALRTVELHDGVTEIGTVFQNCSSLTELKIPASVSKLSSRMFAGCTALRTVELHDGVTEIGEAAFSNCSSLTELKIPASVSKLSSWTFMGCAALRTVELHDGVTEIGEAAFLNCRSLTELKIPASVSKLDSRMFAGCAALRTVELHDGVTEIGTAFKDCSSLTELKIPASVSKLDERMFAGCTALLTVELHDGVKKIGKAAFYNCNSLTEIKAAPGTKIDSGAFYGCTALEAKAKAEGFSSVNEFVVERSMPEGWEMRKGA